MTLQNAIIQKKDEIRQMEANLHSPEYPDKSHAHQQIEVLQGQIEVIEQHLSGESTIPLALLLPACRKEGICLIAFTGFTIYCFYIKEARCKYRYKE